MLNAGLEYTEPLVYLMQDTGIGTSEFAARTCYDSFKDSEHEVIKGLDYQASSYMSDEHYQESYKEDLNSIESSEILDTLAWTYFHHSILEHSVLTFLIKGTSRSVLQEEARHRIQSLSVRSTRYTMSDIINAYVASRSSRFGLEFFKSKIIPLDMFVVETKEFVEIEIETMFKKLELQESLMDIGEFIKTSVAKSSLEFLETSVGPEELFKELQKGKKKKNVGDAFKHLVTDNWKVDMVVTFNLRSLKNFFDLRDSGSAYFQIRSLAKAMKEVTPKKYLKLIDKKARNEV